MPIIHGRTGRVPQTTADGAKKQADLGEVPSWGDDALVVAPISGRFHLHDLPDRITAGSVIGEIRQIRQSEVVISPFSGDTRRLLVADGHRVSSGQPLVWLVKVA